MTSSIRSSNIILSSSASSEHTHFVSNYTRGVVCLEQAIDLASRLSDCPTYEWVDSCILDILTCFRGLYALDGFLSKVIILKPVLMVLPS